MELTNIAVTLKQNELIFAEFYRECAKLFPDYASSFESIALEEEGHAAIIDSIIEEISNHPERWRQGKVSLQTLQLIQKQMKTNLEEVRSGKCAARYAITSLRSYEQSMSERSVEKILDTDVPEYKILLSLISEGFDLHLKSLQDLERRIFKTVDLFDSL